MKKMSYKVIFNAFLALAFFLPSSASSHNNVVVIPLMKDAPTLEPFAPLTAVSPPNSAYVVRQDFVLDRVTGLEWQRRDDNTVKLQSDAFQYCGNLQLAGKEDWRVPSFSELISIVDYGTIEPAINYNVFPETNWHFYWSATPISIGFLGRRIVYFGDGYTRGDYDADSQWYVRCVRGLSPRDNVFIDNSNGTVTDLATGLTWQRATSSAKRNWAQGIEYCQQMDLGGEQDWRLPNIKELQSISENRLRSPAIDNTVFIGDFPSGGRYHSSTVYAEWSSDMQWGVQIGDGFLARTGKLGTNYTRCVRGGK